MTTRVTAAFIPSTNEESCTALLKTVDGYWVKAGHVKPPNVWYRLGCSAESKHIFEFTSPRCT